MPVPSFLSARPRLEPVAIATGAVDDDVRAALARERLIDRHGAIDTLLHGDDSYVGLGELTNLWGIPTSLFNILWLTDCWQLTIGRTRCSENGQRIAVLRTADEIAVGPLPLGTKINAECRTCRAMAQGPGVPQGCEYQDTR